MKSLINNILSHLELLHIKKKIESGTLDHGAIIDFISKFIKIGYENQNKNKNKNYGISLFTCLYTTKTFYNTYFKPKTPRGDGDRGVRGRGDGGRGRGGRGWWDGGRGRGGRGGWDGGRGRGVQGVTEVNKTEKSDKAVSVVANTSWGSSE